MRLRIVVSGLIAQHPRLGGMTWHYLQYLVGLAHLGHDVYYFEDSGQHPYDPELKESGPGWAASDCRYHTAYLAKTLARFGLQDRWAYRHGPSSHWYGLKDALRSSVVRSADLLINVSGTLEHPDRYAGTARLVYVDTDPVVTQVKLASGVRLFRDRVDAHDVHFSFGERLGEAVPRTGHRWRATRQPVLLSEWQPVRESRDVFTTVMSWTSYEPLRYRGRSFGQKDVEFERFLQLPGRVSPVPLELALGRTRHPEWERRETGRRRGSGRPPGGSPGERLARAGWHVVDANLACGDLDRYREYVQRSKAEWSVAKNAYVEGQPGWFSERSACYLASGRPVVVQDTGLTGVLPVGEGLLAYATLEQATDAIREVEGAYDRHARAARELATEWFDSDRVLARLVDEATGS